MSQVAVAAEEAEEQVGGRWRSYGWASVVLRVAVYTAPVIASVVATQLIVQNLPTPDRSVAETAGWLVAILAGTTLVLVVLERIARRFLPLAWLLKLSLAFPDTAPSRLSIARHSTNRELRKLVAEVRSTGLSDDPTKAAHTVLVLASALNAHDRRTRGHSERVRALTEVLAECLDLPEAHSDRLRWAALLHDIGKLVVPAEVLNKSSDLDDAEWDLVKRHPEEGARLARPLRPWLGDWSDAILEHHERWDGSGYPQGLAGPRISLAARIVAVADSYDVMTSVRSYRRPVTPGRARAEIVKCAGSQFDPGVVRPFVNTSIRRLARIVGPLAYLAQIPVLGALPLLAADAPVIAEGTFLAFRAAGSVGAGRYVEDNQITPVRDEGGDEGKLPEEGVPPTAVDDVGRAAPGETKPFDVLANDGAIAEQPTVTVVDPGTAEASVDPQRRLLVVAPDEAGTVSIVYEVCNAADFCDRGTLTLVVS